MTVAGSPLGLRVQERQVDTGELKSCLRCGSIRTRSAWPRVTTLARSRCSCLPRLRFRTCSTRLFSLLAHESCPERLLGRVLIVRTAPEPEPLHRGLAAARERLAMIVF